jgi:hypothetical protein
MDDVSQAVVSRAAIAQFDEESGILKSMLRD